jgi:hypothetical protein
MIKDEVVSSILEEAEKLKKLVFFTLLTLMSCSLAKAQTLPIQQQVTLPTGQTNQWLGAGGGCLYQNSQCWLIPTGWQILACVGTQTIKVPGVEFLGRIVAGISGSPSVVELWTGHHLSTMTDPANPTGPKIPATPTIAVKCVPTDALVPSVAGLITGNGVNAVWWEFQASNNSGFSSLINDGAEIQVDVLVGPPPTQPISSPQVTVVP